MVIGIDASRAFVKDRTGTENYSYRVITEMLRLPEASKHNFVLFIRKKSLIPSWIKKIGNVKVVEIKRRYLWTQLGLAYQTWKKFDFKGKKLSLDRLWIPAHTLPVLRKRVQLKTIVTIHGLEYQWLPEYRNGLQRWYLPLSTIYASKQANKLIAVSKFTKKQLVRRFQTVSNKIKVIYEGVEDDLGKSINKVKLNAVLRRKWRLNKQKYILFVGTLMPRKNLIALIRAFRLIYSDFLDYKLVIVGSKGWLVDEVYIEPKRLDIQDKVLFLGRVSDVNLASLYAGASLYVQPSITEGFGLPVLEAMRLGVPVISSDGGALPEIVPAMGVVKLGVGFEKRLAKKINKALLDSKWRKKMKQLGEERVVEFSWKKTAQLTLKELIS